MNIVHKEKQMMNEKEYRALTQLSYSSIKKFADNKKKFYKEDILGEVEIKDVSLAMIMGSLVDCLAFNQDFEEKFVLATVIPPTGQMLDFVNNLYKRTLQNTQDGEITCSMADLLSGAYNETAFDSAGTPIAFKGKSLEKVIQMFEGSDAEMYYRQLRNSTGKQVVTLNLVENAERIVTELRSNPNTSGIMNATSGDGIEVFEQFPIEFEYLGIPLKSLLDKVIISHTDEIIYPYDLKVTYDSESFGYNYIKMRYYIQNGVYNKALVSWANNNGYGNYSIAPMGFVVCDSTNYYQPVIYETSMEDLDKALAGFTLRGKKYDGVNELLEQIKWHKDTQIWNINMSDAINCGKKPLNLQYDKL